MPPRGVYKARQEEKKKQNRSPRPAQESRSDRKEQERQETANAQRVKHILRLRKAKQDDVKKKQAEANAQKVRANQTKNKMNPVIGSTQAKNKIQQKQNNAVKSSTVSKMSPPLPKPKSPTKFTLKGGQIKSGTIYKDPITGSTLAGKDTRMKAITDPQSVRVQDSRAVKTGGPKGFSRKGSLIDMTPDRAGPKVFTRKGLTPFQQEQVGIVNRLDNPQETKLDFLTGEKLEPTLLTELSKRRKRRQQRSGFTGIMSQIRSLLG